MFTRKQLYKVWSESGDLSILANHLRANALSLIQEAGSGHIGSSFSVIDALLSIHVFEQGSLFPESSTSKYRVFSSKGHDAPAFYAMNHFLGLIPDEKMRLRRLGFLPGHPEIGTGGTFSNTGSLGMGISKAKGFAAADFLTGRETTTYVILGDGELQEGQIWESMADVSKVLGKVVAVVDANRIQSDTWVTRTRDLGDVRERVQACGWGYLEANGHDFEDLRKSLRGAKSLTGPFFIWAKTTKGHGSTELAQFPEDGLFYHAHSGAVSKELADKIFSELLGRENSRENPTLDFSTSTKMTSPSMPNLWANILSKVTSNRDDIIVMDGDLALDTGTYSVAHKIGNRYMQMGIAEQDMVSVAGSMALAGFTPVVHSFATFLTMRPFEQIVNNASERSRVIYVGFLAGIVPSAAGFSHQAVIDAAIMSAVPGMKIFEPATVSELETAFSLALSHIGPTYLRMNSVAPVDDVGDFTAQEDIMGTRFGDGEDFTIVCSGAFTLSNSLQAVERLKSLGIFGKVRTFANKVASLESSLPGIDNSPVLIVENGVQYLGTFTRFENKLRETGGKVQTVSINGFPVNGQPDEVSKHHGMDVESLVRAIQRLIGA